MYKASNESKCRTNSINVAMINAMLHYHHKCSNALKSQFDISFCLNIKEHLFVWINIPNFLPFHEKNLHNSRSMMLLQAGDQKINVGSSSQCEDPELHVNS